MLLRDDSDPVGSWKGVSDWATQASTTLVGGSLVICYNQPVSSGGSVELQVRGYWTRIA